MIVVPVLTTSCHVSLKPKSGPVTAHKMMIAHAPKKAAGCPVKYDAFFESVVNRFYFFIISSFKTDKCINDEKVA